MLFYHETNGYTFNLPEPPSLRTIEGYGKSISEQCANEEKEDGTYGWKFDYKYTNDQFDSLTVEEQREIIDTEDDRCDNGFWFMLEGKPFYITGDNYFFLTFWKIDGFTPVFVKEQAYNFYFYRFCEDDPNSFGSLELKPRREGCTQRKLAIFVNQSRKAKRKWLGILSKTAKDAKNVNFGGLVNGFIDLPDWMKPDVAGDFPPKTVLEFGASAKRITAKNQKKGKSVSQNILRTKIDWSTLTDKAYDGFKLFKLLLDEFAKWASVDSYQTWLTHRKCLEVGYKIIGKAYVLSTIEGNEDKESSAQSIANFVKIWKNSDYTKRNALGRTESGLYRWFIPGWVSKLQDEKGKSLVDAFGNLDEYKANYMIEQEVASASTKKEKQAIRRQNPRTPQEALQSMAASNTFKNEMIPERLKFLNDFEGTEARPQKYRIGNLHWVNNERLGKVRFVDNPEGRFRIAYFPDVAGVEATNAVKILENGGHAPFGTSQFVLGADVFHFDNVHGEGSMGAFLIKLRHNFYNPALSNIYCLEYIHRPDSTDELYEDMAKAAFFYGAKMQVERSAQEFFKWLKRNGMKAFSMLRPESAQWSSYTKKDLGMGTPTSTMLIKIGCELIENYFAPPNAELNENGVDNLENFWFDRTLEQITRFDITETTKFDAVMAMIHTEVGSQSLKRFTPNIETLNNQQPKIQPIDYLFPRYRNGQLVTEIAGQNTPRHRWNT